jgi:hypothetical protein
MEKRVTSYVSLLQNISPYYHQEFKRISKTFQDFEEIKFVCNISSFLDNDEYDTSIFLSIGYMIITSYRIICQYYRSYEKYGALFILNSNAHREQHKVRLSNVKSFPVYKYFLEPPDFPLTNKERKSSTITEITLNSIIQTTRVDYQLKRSERLILVETINTLPDNNFILAFPKYKDGEVVYNLMQKALNSKQKKETEIVSDLGSQLEKLVDLHKNGSITSDEFEAAKKKLLGL